MKEEFKSKYNLSGKTVIGDVIKKYPYIKEYMPMISPEYKKLLDPVQYMMMSKIANLNMIAERGELVDMLFSEGSGSSRTGSTPVTRTIFL